MNRELIYSTLFNTIKGLASFNTSSRTFKHFADVADTDQPALFQVQVREEPSTQTGQPTKWLLQVELYVYVHNGESPDNPPSSQLNPILDAITNLFSPDPVSAKQTLGGLVHYVRVSGAIETDEGLLGPQGIAIIPIEISVP